MISPRTARLVASIHKWLGLIVAAQLLVWTGTGLFFASFAMTQIHGDHLVHPPGHAAPIDLSRVKLSMADALRAVAEDRPAEVILKRLAGDPVYEVRADIGVFVVSAETGEVLSPLSEDIARKIAGAAWAGKGALQSVEEINEAPRESGLSGKVWAAHFAGDGHPMIYVSAANGRLSAPRTDLWRTYDFLWSLHIMDYQTRENFNHPLLVAFAVLALSTVLFGVVLLVHRFTRGVLRGKKETP
ncbi:MAG: hypothetical protein Q8R02_17075 [Hyphomonadaceae bacterium]|nr:hypothetical protein [Hyphomonadaceae bacterium]